MILLRTLTCWAVVIQIVFSLPLSARPRKISSELLLPLHSTTALMCEPVFHTAGTPDSSASWYRDGKKVASVTGEKNAILDGRNYSSEQTMPEVGFLIISEITKDDEGEFWCRSDVTEEAGEVFSLRAAYVDELPKEGHITIEPSRPTIGASLILHCPLPNAVPKPNVIWSLDDEPISYVSSDSVTYPNGTLIIHQLSTFHIGRLQCTVSNFAGKTSTSFTLTSQLVQTKRDATPSSYTSKCSMIFRSSILWFLIGCLATSSGVLLYLLCALVLLRPSPSRHTLRPSMWLRPHPLLGPGFRKAIVPTPDLLVPRMEHP